MRPVHSMPHRVCQVARGAEALRAAGAAGSRAGHPGLRLRVQPQGGVPAHAGAPGAGARRRQAVRGRQRPPPGPGRAAGTQVSGATLSNLAVRMAGAFCRSRSSRSAPACAGASPPERRRPVGAARSALLLPCRHHSRARRAGACGRGAAARRACAGTSRRRLAHGSRLRRGRAGLLFACSHRLTCGCQPAMVPCSALRRGRCAEGCGAAVIRSAAARGRGRAAAGSARRAHGGSPPRRTPTTSSAARRPSSTWTMSWKVAACHLPAMGLGCVTLP